MSRTLLSLANELHHRASIVNLVARDQADVEGQSLARTILSLAVELERRLEAASLIGPVRVNREVPVRLLSRVACPS